MNPAPLVVPIFAVPFGVVSIADAEALNPLLATLFAARALSAESAAGAAGAAGAAAAASVAGAAGVAGVAVAGVAAAETAGAVSAAANSAGRAATTAAFCYHSPDDLLDWRDEPVRRLSAAILRGVYSVVHAVNDFSDAQLRAFKLEARAWYSIVKQHGCVPAAQYPMTAWCGIYCVAAPPPSTTRGDSGVLRFYESRLGTMFQDATNAVMRIPYKQGHYGWRPVPGQMAVFPASLTHEIALLKSPGELMLVTLRARFVGERQQGFAQW